MSFKYLNIIPLVILILNTAQAANDESSYSIGDKVLGGTVFLTNDNGTHGLVAANQDQGPSLGYSIDNACSNPNQHDNAGKEYLDWKTPTPYQLEKMYEQRELIGGFKPKIYWSADWTVGFNFSKGKLTPAYHESGYNYNVRCIRSY